MYINDNQKIEQKRQIIEYFQFKKEKFLIYNEKDKINKIIDFLPEFNLKIININQLKYKKCDYLCIGVQKSGTTSLINYLNSHPKLYCYKEELHFFDQPKKKILTELEFHNYGLTFNTEKLFVGEKCPSYSYLNFSIDRIYDYNPDIKLIIILREPIQRFYSQYNMNYSNTPNMFIESKILSLIMDEKNKNLSSIENNQNCYIIRGFYDEQIEYILSNFDKKKIYIGIAEEIALDKNKEYNKIFNFLGVESKTNIIDEDSFIGTYKYDITMNIKKKLYEIYLPHNKKLYNILGRRIEVWEKYYKENKLY